MTFRLRSTAAMAVLAALSLGIVACGPRSATTTEQTTTNTTQVGDSGTATTTTTTSSTTTASGNVPAECQAYLTAVQACVDRVSASNPQAASAVRQQLEQTRAQWSSISDQAALAQACTTATNAWNGMKGAMGC